MTTSVMSMPKFIEIKNVKIVADMLQHSSTVSSIGVIPCADLGYSDEQFYADVKKAGKKLDSMVEQALREDAEGKTREFPV